MKGMKKKKKKKSAERTYKIVDNGKNISEKYEKLSTMFLQQFNT